MREIFSSYWQALIHPFQVHHALRAKRLAGGVVIGPGFQAQAEPLDFVEGISISWIWACFYGLYSLLGMMIGLAFLDHALARPESLFMTLWSYEAQRFTVYFVILEVILFPLSQFFYLKFWGMLIKFFCVLFDMEERREEVTAEVVNHSLTSNFFLIIPVFGKVLRYGASLFYLYAGLRANIGLNMPQAMMVLFAPIMLVLFFVFLLILYFALIISLI